jgi:hypothetical protein
VESLVTFARHVINEHSTASRVLSNVSANGHLWNLWREGIGISDMTSMESMRAEADEFHSTSVA